MKKRFLLFVLVSFGQLVFSQVGINTSTPHTSAILDVTSSTKGFLVPRLTTANITTLSATASEGLIVFDTDTKTFKGWNGTKWKDLSYEPGTTTGTIMTQTFETTSTVNYTTSGGTSPGFSFKSGNSASTEAPASTALYSEASRSYGYTNSAATNSYIEFNIIDATNYTNNITFSFDVAAFSINTNGNGVENTDSVWIDISTDGGTTYSTKLTLTGGNSSTGSNVRWAFTGTGTATNTYSSSNSTVKSSNTSTASGITLTGAEAITKMSVTGIPNSSQLKIRIGVKNDSANELWLIDNVKLEAL